MRTATLIATALITLSTTPALAERGPGTVAAVTPVEAAPARTPKVAAALAVGGTALGWGLFVGGIAMMDRDPDSAATDVGRGSTIAGLGLATIGPAAGHLYAGEGGHALITSAARAAGGLMIAGGALMADPIDVCVGAPCRRSGNDAGWVIAGVGAALVVGTTIYDVVDAPRAARRANRRAARAVVVPTAMRGSDGVVPGMVVAGSF